MCGTFDKYAEKLGVDIENLIISQPECGEQALEFAENLIRSGALTCCYDSVAALKSEIEGEMGILNGGFMHVTGH
jgi:recombination protein RecA